MMTFAAKTKAAVSSKGARSGIMRFHAVLLCAALGACSMMSSKDKHAETPAPRVLPPPTPRTDGAIYQAGQEMALFADLKARRIGDVVTIVLNESTNASKSAITKTTKSSATADTATTIFGKSITTTDQMLEYLTTNLT